MPIIHKLLIIKCLQYKSSSAYEALRSTGVIKLPSGRTLRDYKHFAPPVTRFSDEYDKQLLDFAKKKSGVLSKHVGIMIDKHTEALTGFLDLVEVISAGITL